MEENKASYPDNVLFQQVETYFKPAKHWENCLTPLTTEQFYEQIHDLLPGFFDNEKQLRRILVDLGFKYSHNEHNNKYYWLVNPV